MRPGTTCDGVVVSTEEGWVFEVVVSLLIVRMKSESFCPIIYKGDRMILDV